MQQEVAVRKYAGKAEVQLSHPKNPPSPRQVRQVLYHTLAHIHKVYIEIPPKPRH